MDDPKDLELELKAARAALRDAHAAWQSFEPLPESWYLEHSSAVQKALAEDLDEDEEREEDDYE